MRDAGATPTEVETPVVVEATTAVSGPPEVAAAGPGCRADQARSAARALAMVSGGPLVAAGLGATGACATVRAVRKGRRPPVAALVATVGLVGYLTVVRPWARRWGASPAEVAETLPGDELIPRPGLSMTRAVTIDAPVDEVWPWLAQIGQDRAGFYSYTWLENLAGCRMPEVHELHPEWQDRELGAGVPLHPLNALPVARFEPNRSYAFKGWYFALEPLGKHKTRLFARTRVPWGLPSLAYALFLEAPHFVMERKMLLGIKAHAEGRPTA